MPEGRLEELLEQALTSQWSDAEYSSPAHQPVSLLTDYCHHKLQVPTQTCQVALTLPACPSPGFCSGPLKTGRTRPEGVGPDYPFYLIVGVF